MQTCIRERKEELRVNMGVGRLRSNWYQEVVGILCQPFFSSPATTLHSQFLCSVGVRYMAGVKESASWGGQGKHLGLGKEKGDWSTLCNNYIPPYIKGADLGRFQRSHGLLKLQITSLESGLLFQVGLRNRSVGLKTLTYIHVCA